MIDPPAPSKLDSVLLVGGGTMGAALLEGWCEAGLQPSWVVDPSPRAARLHRPGQVQVAADPGAVPAGFAPAAIVLAVKPQQADAILPDYARFRGPEAVVLSIMAGWGIARIRRLLPDAPVVRAMPNSPAAIRRGITVACASDDLDPERRDFCHALLAAAGQVAWVEDEALLDPVTAISGGGPAYVFLLAELLEQAGAEQGLPPALARDLARHTVAGAGALLDARPEDAAALRRAVTSPNGTTEQALAVLMAADAWPATMSHAIAAATSRARALGAA